MSRPARQAGYSLAELLVVVAVLGLTVAAVAGVYAFFQQTYTRAASLEDAQLGARAGVDRMVLELRLVGSYWAGVNGAGSAIIAASATSVTFIGDVDADTLDGAGGEVSLAQSAVAGSTVVRVDRATGADGGPAFAPGEYLFIANGATREARAIAAVTGTTLTLASALVNAYPVGSLVRSVETVTYGFDAPTSTLTRSMGGGAADPIVDNVTDLTLTYFDEFGAPLALPPNLPLIREVGISLTCRGGDGSRRIISTRVKPRSLALL